jgi:hypothetical protein
MSELPSRLRNILSRRVRVRSEDEVRGLRRRPRKDHPGNRANPDRHVEGDAEAKGAAVTKSSGGCALALPAGIAATAVVVRGPQLGLTRFGREALITSIAGR